jgi:hypothetical protein
LSFNRPLLEYYHSRPQQVGICFLYIYFSAVCKEELPSFQLDCIIFIDIGARPTAAEDLVETERIQEVANWAAPQITAETGSGVFTSILWDESFVSHSLIFLEVERRRVVHSILPSANVGEAFILSSKVPRQGARGRLFIKAAERKPYLCATT